MYGTRFAAAEKLNGRRFWTNICPSRTGSSTTTSRTTWLPTSLPASPSASWTFHRAWPTPFWQTFPPSMAFTLQYFPLSFTAFLALQSTFRWAPTHWPASWQPTLLRWWWCLMVHHLQRIRQTEPGTQSWTHQGCRRMGRAKLNIQRSKLAPA